MKVLLTAFSSELARVEDEMALLVSKLAADGSLDRARHYGDESQRCKDVAKEHGRVVEKKRQKAC